MARTRFLGGGPEQQGAERDLALIQITDQTFPLTALILDAVITGNHPLEACLSKTENWTTYCTVSGLQSCGWVCVSVSDMIASKLRSWEVSWKTDVWPQLVLPIYCSYDDHLGTTRINLGHHGFSIKNIR